LNRPKAKEMMTIKLELADSSRETYNYVISYCMNDKELSMLHRDPFNGRQYYFKVEQEEILKMEVKDG